MRVGIVTIGDEILIGQTVDTNTAWLGASFAEKGFRVQEVVSVRDQREHIVEALDRFVGVLDVVIITGGLGPTSDDITKETLAAYFNTHLIEYPEVLKKIEAFFKARGRDADEVHRAQAMLPEACTCLINNRGTASGMWFERSGSVCISLPGVPYEMKGIMTDYGFPKLLEKFNPEPLFNHTLQTQGVGETYLAERLVRWEAEIKEKGFGVAYLPSPGRVKVRVTGYLKTEDDQQFLDEKLEQFRALFPKYYFGDGEVSLEEVVGQLLTAGQHTIGVAESCTGGQLAGSLTSISGSSAYFKGGIVAYDNEIKARVLGVDEDALQQYGAVSEQVIELMALGAQAELGVDYALATSGVAGPTGGSDEKPVGTVWIAVATPSTVFSQCFSFGDNRERNVQRSVLTALNLLRCALLGLK